MSLVRSSEVDAFTAAVKEAYYKPLLAKGLVSEEEMPETMFASRPSSGGAVLKL